MLDEARYVYDVAGRRSSVTQFDGPRAYTYDQAGRVISADNPGAHPDESFAYDLLGNRTNRGEQYDGANRLQSRAGFTYEWDREGRATKRTNTASGAEIRLVWSPEGLLRTASPASGPATTYKYDPFGRRVATVRNGQTRIQVYGLDGNAVAEMSGSTLTRYAFGTGLDEPLAMTAAGVSSYFQQDAIHSVTSLSNGAGAVTGRYAYDTFGEIRSHSGVDSPYTYTGREYDASSGLYDYRARWYDAASNRFISEDPVPADNLYRYVENDPVSRRDPTGLMSLIETDEIVLKSGQIMRMTWPRGMKPGGAAARAKAEGNLKASLGARASARSELNGFTAKVPKHKTSPHNGVGDPRAGASRLDKAIAAFIKLFF